MSMTREAARSLARDVLIDKVLDAKEPGLEAVFLDMVAEGHVGYAMAVPLGDGRQAVSRPAMRLTDAQGREDFEHAFDEGLRVIRELKTKTEQEKETP